MYCRVLNWILTDVSEVCAASIIRAARTSETSVDIQLRTRQYIPEDCTSVLYCLYLDHRPTSLVVSVSLFISYLLIAYKIHSV
jgi:hypothetical protein